MQPIVSSLPGDDPDVADLLRQFVQGNLPKMVHDIRSGAQRRDPAALKSEAHRLKGVGGGYGYPMLTEVCLRIEEVSAVADWGAIDRLVAELEGYLEAIVKGMKSQ